VAKIEDYRGQISMLRYTGFTVVATSARLLRSTAIMRWSVVEVRNQISLVVAEFEDPQF
jgi:hypothetical protein